MYKRHIILDLDGTLIANNDIFITPRPGLKEFFSWLFTCPYIETISIFTAASKIWYDHVFEYCLKYLLPAGKSFYFVWTNDKCTNKINCDKFNPNKKIILKKLKKVWKNFKQMNNTNTLIIDDTPSTYMNNYENAIPINTYTTGDDRELIFIKSVLEKSFECEDVRLIKKQKNISELLNYL